MDSYIELNIPSRALEYGKALKTKLGTIEAWNYAYPITAANLVGKHDLALSFIEDAKKVNSKKDPIKQLVIYVLELTT